MELNE